MNAAWVFQGVTWRDLCVDLANCLATQMSFLNVTSFLLVFFSIIQDKLAINFS